MGVCGNGASYEVQKEAEADKAELLIATTSSDETNIVACLVAKKLGVQHTIARIRNPEYEKPATTKTAPATKPAAAVKPAAHSHVESKTPAHHTPSHPKAKHDTISHQ